MKTITLKIIGIHCTNCAVNIDFELEDLKGIKEATTNYATQQTVVSYDPKVTSLQKIREIIQKLDYKCCSV